MTQVEFDNVHVGETLRRELKIANGLERILVVKQAESSCTCLNIVGMDRSIAPKGTGTLIVEFRPVESGPGEFEVLVETDCADNPLRTFLWEGIVLAPGPDARAINSVDSGFKAYISDQELLQNLKSTPNTLLVDVRIPEKFALARIEKSINVPLSAAGAFIGRARRNVFLIGEGHDDFTLVREVLSLEKKGIVNVRILRGGFRSWALSKRPMIGTAIGTARPALVAVSDLFSFTQDDWVIFSVSSPGLSARMPGAQDLSFIQGREGEFREKLQSVLLSRPRSSKALIVSALGESYEEIEKALPQGIPVPIFYLAGGAGAYDEFSGSRQALSNRKVIRISGAGLENILDPSGGRSVGTGAGCATCPKRGGAK